MKIVFSGSKQESYVIPTPPDLLSHTSRRLDPHWDSFLTFEETRSYRNRQFTLLDLPFYLPRYLSIYLRSTKRSEYTLVFINI